MKRLFVTICPSEYICLHLDGPTYSHKKGITTYSSYSALKRRPYLSELHMMQHAFCVRFSQAGEWRVEREREREFSKRIFSLTTINHNLYSNFRGGGGWGGSGPHAMSASLWVSLKLYDEEDDCWWRYSYKQGSDKKWALGCVNPVSWLALATRREFTQPREGTTLLPIPVLEIRGAKKNSSLLGAYKNNRCCRVSASLLRLHRRRQHVSSSVSSYTQI